MNSLSRRHLPRLLPEAYRGRRFVHWTMAIADRQQGWLTDGFHTAFRDIMHRLSGKYRVVIPVYCLMPDHLHILAAGIGSDTDQLLSSKAARRALNLVLAPHRLQKQAYDHVLRPDESGADAFTTLAFYIAENPVRAGLSAPATVKRFRQADACGCGPPRCLAGLHPEQPSPRR